MEKELQARLDAQDSILGEINERLKEMAKPAAAGAKAALPQDLAGTLDAICKHLGIGAHKVELPWWHPSHVGLTEYNEKKQALLDEIKRGGEKGAKARAELQLAGIL